MTAHPNNYLIYIRNESRKEWLKLGKDNKSGFVNWCIQKGYIEKYLKELKKGSE